MAGPNLEIFKFGFYVFFPIAFMSYFGAPIFYDKHVRQATLWPDQDKLNKPPQTKEDLRAEVERLRSMRQERRQQEQDN
ncbi:uncharacterized protein VTP21DRAFT_4987 [Calcarisporiella thermophila]|uniref:uncharacterized protein n=1 Tax=Calcarisporiella thermophila TaxID=911321 RepID=UPI003743DF1B